MIPLKNSTDLKKMKEGGRLTACALEEVLSRIEAGVSTWELDQLAEKFILETGGQPSFKGFEGYPFSTCININEGVVHGLPAKDKIVSQGDLISVDLGVFYRGFHTDAARTKKVQDSADRFLLIGQRALEKAVERCWAGKRIGDISSAIQETIEGAGYFVVRELVGHGVGRKLHEPPSVPGYGSPGEGPKLKEGMALAIEVIYSQRPTEVVKSDDGWTILAKGGSITGLFEDTVAITRHSPIVLTGRRDRL